MTEQAKGTFALVRDRLDSRSLSKNQAMMTFRGLANYIGAEPFRPFRIRMTSGETFEIGHPEMIQIGRTTATVFTWMNEDDDAPKEREREISILLIESIEPLRSAAASD